MINGEIDAGILKNTRTGAVVKGMFVNRLPSGTCKVFLNGKLLYEGDLELGKPHGYGTVFIYGDVVREE